MGKSFWVPFILLFVFVMAVITACFISDAHVYDKVVIDMSNGTVFEAENVRIKDKTENWRIVCEDGTVYIVPKEKCTIID